MHDDMTLLIRRFEAPPISPRASGSTLPPSDSFSLPVDSPDNSLPSVTTTSSRSDHTLNAYVDWSAWETAWDALDDHERKKFHSILAQPSPSSSLKREKIEEEEECRSEVLNTATDLTAHDSGGTTPVSAPPAVGEPALSSYQTGDERMTTSNDSSEHYAAGDMWREHDCKYWLVTLLGFRS